PGGNGYLTNVVAVAAGGYHSLALKSDGTVWAWGDNTHGQLGNGTYNSSSFPVQVKNLTGVIAIAAGENHSLALKSDKTVWAWGANNYGQLGTKDYARRNTPTKVKDENTMRSRAIAIAAGGQASMAITDDGRVWNWGSNSRGQLGIGESSKDTPDVWSPISPNFYVSMSTIGKIERGYNFAFAVAASNGKLWGWGANTWGQLGAGTDWDYTLPVETGMTSVLDVSGGYAHSLFVKSDGTVWATGRNYYGQL